MMDEFVLGAYLTDTFLPFVPFIAGGIIAHILLVLILVMFRAFLPEDKIL